MSSCRFRSRYYSIVSYNLLILSQQLLPARRVRSAKSKLGFHSNRRRQLADHSLIQFPPIYRRRAAEVTKNYRRNEAGWSKTRQSGEFFGADRIVTRALSAITGGADLARGQEIDDLTRAKLLGDSSISWLLWFGRAHWHRTRVRITTSSVRL